MKVVLADDIFAIICLDFQKTLQNLILVDECHCLLVAQSSHHRIDDLRSTSFLYISWTVGLTVMLPVPTNATKARGYVSDDINKREDVQDFKRNENFNSLPNMVFLLHSALPLKSCVILIHHFTIPLFLINFLKVDIASIRRKHAPAPAPVATTPIVRF